MSNSRWNDNGINEKKRKTIYRAGKGAPCLKLLCVPWENGSKLEPKNQKPYRNNLSQDEVILVSTYLEDSSHSKEEKFYT